MNDLTGVCWCFLRGGKSQESVTTTSDFFGGLHRAKPERREQKGCLRGTMAGMPHAAQSEQRDWLTGDGPHQSCDMWGLC